MVLVRRNNLVRLVLPRVALLLPARKGRGLRQSPQGPGLVQYHGERGIAAATFFWRHTFGHWNKFVDSHHRSMVQKYVRRYGA